MIGHRIISQAPGMEDIAMIARHHHQTYCGGPRTYPDADVCGEQLTLEARIMSVADSYDAMTTDRPYRKGLSAESALAELRRYSGTQFDPVVVAAFEKVLFRLGKAPVSAQPQPMDPPSEAV